MHPILFEIGRLTIRSYGVLVALAIFIGFSLLYTEAKKRKFYPEKILDMELYILVFGIIGARALHVAANIEYYRANLLEIPMLWRGGLAIYGGLFFGIIAGWIYVVKNRMPIWKTGDLIFPYLALGQAIGRIGCFFNGCCFGKIYDGVNGHPTQLYASLALVSIFVVLKLIERKPRRDGLIFALYPLFYSTQRFFIDFFRADTPRYIFGLTVSQLISVVVFLVAIYVWKLRWKS